MQPFGRFFRRRAPQKVIDQRRKKNDFCEIDLSTPNGHLGANQFTKYTRRMAIRCRFENPERCTAHGKRKEGVSAMVNAKESVDDEVHRKSSRHKSIASNLRYRVANDTAMDKKFDALLDKGEIGKKIDESLSVSVDNEVSTSINENFEKNVPHSNMNISSSNAPKVIPEAQISHLGPHTYTTTAAQVHQQVPQMFAPQVIQYAPQPNFFQPPTMQVYNSAVPQPFFQQIAPNYSSFQAPSMYMNGTPVIVQQPQFVAQQPQVQYLHQNIVASSNTYTDGSDTAQHRHPESGM